MSQPNNVKPYRKKTEPVDPFFEKPLPSNLEAERLLLGIASLTKEVISQIADRLQPDDFASEANKRIYEAIVQLYNDQKEINSVMIFEALKRAGLLDFVGGPAYIASLLDNAPRFITDVTSLVDTVYEKSILRQIAKAGAFITQLALDGEYTADESLEAAAQAIFKLTDRHVGSNLLPIGGFVEHEVITMEERAGQETLLTGIPTGFYDDDYMTGGLQPGELTIIAARPGMGKTSYMMDAVQYAASQAKDGRQLVAGVFSLEMTTPQLIRRAICSRARLDSHRAKMGVLNTDDWRRIAVAAEELKAMKIFMDDTPGLTVMEMRAKARRLKYEQKGLDLLAVDYLQLMSGVRGQRYENRQAEVASISRDLKKLAKELNVPIIALCQLSRAPETRGGNHKPQLSDLRESGGIENDADVVKFIYREDFYFPETERQNIAEIIFGKHRNGPVGTVELVFLKQCTRFENKWREER